ncbi:sulfatase [Gammaproteobacteria bacterium]|nr:sulfatase [Gammaproteobacteria bacterium]
MRILYVDIDTLRVDHLGCYGYHRNTSPNIDLFAKTAMRFNNVHASDTPCLPSRSALLTGRFGIHNGVVNHGGTDADPVIGGPKREFWSEMQLNSFPSRLKRAGLRTCTISSFAQRHSAFHWYAGFDEAQRVPGSFGLETADQVYELARSWLERNGAEDNWFLHVHLWDPHTPYRAAASYGEPFAEEPLPEWLTEEVRENHWLQAGPHSAQECNGFAPKPAMLDHYPRQPQQISNMHDVRKMFDGYDTGVLVADEYFGRLLNDLEDLGVGEDVAVMVSSDHGETLGELNVYGDHQTADQLTTRIPMILKWPHADHLNGKSFDAMHYQIDLMATLVELLGVRVPGSWDGKSFAESLNDGEDLGRGSLILSQGAWTCQRSVRWGDYMLIKTLHDGFHLYDDLMLFNVVNDPHEMNNLAGCSPEIIDEGLSILDGWYQEMMPQAARGRDPLLNVIEEGGPYHVRGQLGDYLARLRDTGREKLAEQLDEKHN